MYSDLIKIVLIKTSHPGNIGSAARAMRVMGIKNLTLVEPKFFPHGRASAMASGALDVLENAQVVSTLEQALEGCQLAYATTARPRHISSIAMDVRTAAQEVAQKLQQEAKPIAIVFGTERTGMSNSEIDLCQRLLHIPTANDYNSLNLAQAVQVITYELFIALNAINSDLQPQTNIIEDDSVISIDDMERFYEHLERVMIHTEFLNPEQPKHLMRRLRKLFSKANPDRNEINILRGILTACERLFKH